MGTRTVGEIIAEQTLARIGPDASVSEACFVLERLDVGALAVLEDDRLVGVLSERDVIRKCICKSRLTSATLVETIMTENPMTVDVDTALTDALRIMVENGFRHLPVMADGRPRGMLSMRDIPAVDRVALEGAEAPA